MLTALFTPFPELTTARLRLRAFVAADAPALHRLRSDERVMQYLARARSRSVEDAAEHIRTCQADLADSRSLTWAMALRDHDVLVGTVGLYRPRWEHHRVEVGYLLSPDQWGRGLMDEALAAVVDHAFAAFGFHSLEANTDPRNAASRRLLERNGFVLEGLFREDYFFEGRFLDSAIYSRLAPR